MRKSQYDTPVTFKTLIGIGLQMIEGQICLDSSTVRDERQWVPERLPNTIKSSRELPINRFRPCRPPEASPATNKMFHVRLAVLTSIFTPPF